MELSFSLYLKLGSLQTYPCGFSRCLIVDKATKNIVGLTLGFIYFQFDPAVH